MLGSYYLTMEPRTGPTKKQRVPLLSGYQEVVFAMDDGAMAVHDWVDVPNPDYQKVSTYGNADKKILRTTVVG